MTDSEKKKAVMENKLNQIAEYVVQYDKNLLTEEEAYTAIEEVVNRGEV